MHIVYQYDGPMPNSVGENRLHSIISKSMTLCDLNNGVMTSKSKLGQEDPPMHIVNQYA